MATAPPGYTQAPPEEPPRVLVNDVDIQGNTVLSAAALEDFKAPYVGKKLTLEDIRGVARTLQDLYAKKGYATARVVVPPQALEGAADLELRVVEGHIGNVKITGNEHFSPRNYKPYLPKAGDVLNINELENSLNVINSHPDKQANLILREGSEPGTTDIDVRVKDERPWHFKVALDNTGTRETEYLRTRFTIQYDNFFDRSHIGVFQYATSPRDRHLVKQYAFAYYMPLGPMGVQDSLFWDASRATRRAIADSWLSFYCGLSESNTEDVLDILQLAGKGRFFGVAYSVPLPDFGKTKQMVTVGVEWTEIEDTVEFGKSKFKDDIEKLPLILRWEGSRKDDAGSTALAVGLRYQADHLVMGFDDHEYDRIRAGVDPSYWVMLMQAQRMQKLPRDWTAVLSGEAQLTGERLLPSEQYAFGGYDSVRGYRSRTIVADTGFTLRGELRGPTLAPFLPPEWKADEKVQLLGFIDYGLCFCQECKPRTFRARRRQPAGRRLRHERYAVRRCGADAS